MLDHVLLSLILIPLAAALLLLACNRSIDTYYREKAPDGVANGKGLFFHVCRDMISITFILCLAVTIPFSFAGAGLEGVVLSVFGSILWSGFFGGILGCFVGGAAALGAKKSMTIAKIYALAIVVFCGFSGAFL
mgnify:CR=1 FL=1